MDNILDKISTVLHSFDHFKLPVANLNMKGKSHYRTRLGGFCALSVYGLLVWFVFVRFQKMMSRRNPVIYEVT